MCDRAYGAISRILPMPETKVLVDVDPQVAMGRIFDRGEDLEVFETVERLSAVRERMLRLSDGWEVIDNGSSPEDLAERVRGIIGRMP